MSQTDEHQTETDTEADRRRAIAAAQTWYPTEGGIRDYVALAAFVAVVVGAAMVWTCLPAAMAMLKSSRPDRLEFFLAYAGLIIAPVAAWALWHVRRFGLAIVVLLLFALAVGALLPVARG